jgi:hypothetical protein
MALSGHADGAEQCPLSGAERTWPNDVVMSAYDPFGHLVNVMRPPHRAAKQTSTE